MIQVNDLRIGNLVRWSGHVVSVNTGSEIDLMAPKAYPVDITPEWLERCGRKCDIDVGWEYQIQVGALNWYFRWNTEWYSEVGGIYIDSRVQYVHQLQNLFFALTGKEIEIKEPAQK